MSDEMELANAKRLTAARLSFGAGNGSVRTSEHLRFQLDHALARDAVNARMDVPALQRGLQERGLPSVVLRSAVPVAKRDRRAYLLRPDLGRRLAEELVVEPTSAEVVFLLADGLSAYAVEHHALPLLDAILKLIDGEGLAVGPVYLASEARVALGDEIGERLGAKLTVMLIGERPGLSSPDSLGVYLTWEPRRGRSDAERNCISNIRGEGLSYAAAASRIVHYIREARRLQTTGIALKDPDVALGRNAAVEKSRS